MSLSPSKIAVAAGLPSGSVGAATADSEAAYSAFKSISDHLGRWSDEQAKIESARQGAVEGQAADYVSQGATTIRGRARDSAGDATFLAQTQAAFASDAMDALQAHQNDPAGFKAADWQPVFPQGATSPFATANTVKLAPQQVLVLKKKPT